MAKIKLTESQLKQVISESVKNILTEMYWGTLYKAGLKANKMGQRLRAQQFFLNADRELKKEYGNFITIEGSSFTFKGENKSTYMYKPVDDKIQNMGNMNDPVEPGSLRFSDRRKITAILDAIKFFNPNSKFLNKNYWIA